MKIVIIGGGIGGCASYIALKKHLPKPPVPAKDHEFAIYEAYDMSPNLTDEHAPGETYSATLTVGGALGIAPNGLRVLKRLDETLYDDAAKAGYPYSHMKMKSARGFTLVDWHGEINGMKPIIINRRAIWNCLRNRVPDDIIHQKRVSQVIARPDGRNIVKFTDGSPDVEADLVLGADGLKSTVKKAVFPGTKEDTYKPQYEGVVGVGGFLPSADFKDLIEPDCMSFVFGGNGFFGYGYDKTSEPDTTQGNTTKGPAKPGDTIIWWSTYESEECPDPKTLDLEAVHQDLKSRHGSWKNPVVQKVIQNVQVKNMYPTWTTPELPTWERDGVVLIGDAAHALPPTSGQGSSQALEDCECFSMLLAHFLAKSYSSGSVHGAEKAVIKQAAEKHMEIRQPRVKDILTKARSMQNQKKNLNVAQEWMMYILFYIMGLFPMPSWMRNSFAYNVVDDVKRVIESDSRNDAKPQV